MLVTAIIAAAPLTANAVPISGSGDLYVFTTLGDYGDEVCLVARSTDLTLEDVLSGAEDHEICIDGATSC